MLYLWQFIIADILFGLLELEAIAFKLGFPFVEPVEALLVFVGREFAVAGDVVATIQFPENCAIFVAAGLLGENEGDSFDGLAN